MYVLFPHSPLHSIHIFSAVCICLYCIFTTQIQRLFICILSIFKHFQSLFSVWFCSVIIVNFTPDKPVFGWNDAVLCEFLKNFVKMNSHYFSCIFAVFFPFSSRFSTLPPCGLSGRERKRNLSLFRNRFLNCFWYFMKFLLKTHWQNGIFPV